MPHAAYAVVSSPPKLVGKKLQKLLMSFALGVLGLGSLILVVIDSYIARFFESAPTQRSFSRADFATFSGGTVALEACSWISRLC